MRLDILENKNLQGEEKAIFTIFFAMKFLEHNITYCKLIN